MERRVGILGGTFNPIHLGHLILAQTAFETLGLSAIVFIPCHRPPHKETTPLVAARHRLAMVEAAIEGDWRFRASDIEIRRGGISYAVDTLLDLHTADSTCAYYFIIGADTLLELHLWKDIERLLTLCTFVTFARPRIDVETIRPDQLNLPAPWPHRLLTNVVTSRLIDISSSDIRHRIAEGLSIRYLVPAAVEMYIAEHRLYQGSSEQPE
ncbi:MAG: nicotinate-nucleotide adenylyltransferase [Kiritimatiellia bacterium]